MLDARSDEITGIIKKKPYKVTISFITLVAFFFNIMAYDIAWSDRTPSELTSVGSERAVGPGVKNRDCPPGRGMPKVGTVPIFKELSPRTFSLPPFLGTVKDAWSSSNPLTRSPANSLTIIHIQDAHCNYYAQHAIANILEYLTREYGVAAINLEGGAKDYDLSIFTGIKDKTKRAKIADYFVKEGLVNGAEYFALNNPDKATLWGIEDVKSYIDNLKVYRDSLKFKPDADKLLASLSSVLTSLKMKIYSKELLDLDAKYNRYKAGNMEFKDYLAYLVRLSSVIARSAEFPSVIARRPKADEAISKVGTVPIFPNIFLLNRVMKEELDIDFRKANNQRDDLIDKLEKRLSKNAMRELIAKTVEFKSGAISQEEFYGYLVKSAVSVNVPIENFPELGKYIAYISKYSSVDKMKITEEMDALEQSVREAVIARSGEGAIASPVIARRPKADEAISKTGSQQATQSKCRQLDRLSRNLAILKNLFNISLTRDDYEYYKANESAFDMANYTSFIEREINGDCPPGRGLTKVGTVPIYSQDIARLDRYRASMSKFYECSFARDEAFLKNLTATGAGSRFGQNYYSSSETEFLSSRLRSKDKNSVESRSIPRIVVIVTGGFHTENLTEQFKRNNIAYISIMPNFRTEDGYQCPYIKVLSGANKIELAKAVPVMAAANIPPPTQLCPAIKTAAAEAFGELTASGVSKPVIAPPTGQQVGQASSSPVIARSPTVSSGATKQSQSVTVEEALKEATALYNNPAEPGFGEGLSRVMEKYNGKYAYSMGDLVVNQKEGILILGSSGSGKSALAYALTMAGAKFTGSDGIDLLRIGNVLIGGVNPERLHHPLEYRSGQSGFNKDKTTDIFPVRQFVPITTMVVIKTVNGTNEPQIKTYQTISDAKYNSSHVDYLLHSVGDDLDITTILEITLPALLRDGQLKPITDRLLHRGEPRAIPPEGVHASKPSREGNLLSLPGETILLTGALAAIAFFTGASTIGWILAGISAAGVVGLFARAIANPANLTRLEQPGLSQSDTSPKALGRSPAAKHATLKASTDRVYKLNRRALIKFLGSTVVLAGSHGLVPVAEMTSKVNELSMDEIIDRITGILAKSPARYTQFVRSTDRLIVFLNPQIPIPNLIESNLVLIRDSIIGELPSRPRRLFIKNVSTEQVRRYVVSFIERLSKLLPQDQLSVINRFYENPLNFSPSAEYTARVERLIAEEHAQTILAELETKMRSLLARGDVGGLNEWFLKDTPGFARVLGGEIKFSRTMIGAQITPLTERGATGFYNQLSPVQQEQLRQVSDFLKKFFSDSGTSLEKVSHEDRLSRAREAAQADTAADKNWEREMALALDGWYTDGGFVESGAIPQGDTLRPAPSVAPAPTKPIWPTNIGEVGKPPREGKLLALSPETVFITGALAAIAFFTGAYTVGWILACVSAAGVVGLLAMESESVFGGYYESTLQFLLASFEGLIKNVKHFVIGEKISPQDDNAEGLRGRIINDVAEIQIASDQNAFFFAGNVKYGSVLERLKRLVSDVFNVKTRVLKPAEKGTGNIGIQEQAHYLYDSERGTSSSFASRAANVMQAVISSSIKGGYSPLIFSGDQPKDNASNTTYTGVLVPFIQGWLCWILGLTTILSNNFVKLFISISPFASKDTTHHGESQVGVVGLFARNIANLANLTRLDGLKDGVRVYEKSYRAKKAEELSGKWPSQSGPLTMYQTYQSPLSSEKVAYNNAAVNTSVLSIGIALAAQALAYFGLISHGWANIIGIASITGQGSRGSDEGEGGFKGFTQELKSKNIKLDNYGLSNVWKQRDRIFAAAERGTGDTALEGALGKNRYKALSRKQRTAIVAAVRKFRIEPSAIVASPSATSLVPAASPAKAVVPAMNMVTVRKIVPFEQLDPTESARVMSLCGEWYDRYFAPGINDLRGSGFTYYDTIFNACRTIPVPEWKEELVATVNAMRGTVMNDPRSVDYLNKLFFMRHNLLAFPRGNTLAIGYIDSEKMVDVSGRTVFTYRVWTLTQRVSDGVAGLHYLPLYMIVIPKEISKFNVVMTGKHPNPSVHVMNAFNAMNAIESRNLRHYGGQLALAREDAAFLEEMAHTVDMIRAERVLGSQFMREDDDFMNAFVRANLSKAGRLSHLWNNPPSDMFGLNPIAFKALFFHSLCEFSAQMVAGALEHDPTFTLDKWLTSIIEFQGAGGPARLREHFPHIFGLANHAMAGYYGLWFLSQELADELAAIDIVIERKEDHSLNDMITFNDYKISRLVSALSQMPTDVVRSAMRRICEERELANPIDESIFNELYVGNPPHNRSGNLLSLSPETIFLTGAGAAIAFVSGASTTGWILACVSAAGVVGLFARKFANLAKLTRLEQEPYDASGGLFQKIFKILYGHFGGFDNGLEGPAVNFSVVGNDKGKLFGWVKRFNVASALSNLYISRPQKGVDNLVSGEQRRFHIARRNILWAASGRIFSGSISKYSKIASFIFLIASFSVLPWLTHPDNAGTLATMYPSSPFSSTTLSFIFFTSLVLSVISYTISELTSQEFSAPAPPGINDLLRGPNDIIALMIRLFDRVITYGVKWIAYSVKRLARAITNPANLTGLEQVSPSQGDASPKTQTQLPAPYTVTKPFILPITDQPLYELGKGTVKIDGKEIDARRYIKTQKFDSFPADPAATRGYFSLLREAMDRYSMQPQKKKTRYITISTPGEPMRDVHPERGLDENKTICYRIGQGVIMALAPVKGAHGQYVEIFIRNGDVIGYGLTVANPNGNIAVSFKVFTPFRAEKAGLNRGWLYIDRLAVLYKTLDNPRYFWVPAYQLGFANGGVSSAPVFYLKLGFVPLDEATRRLAARLAPEPRLTIDQLADIAHSLHNAEPSKQYFVFDMGSDASPLSLPQAEKIRTDPYLNNVWLALSHFARKNTPGLAAVVRKAFNGKGTYQEEFLGELVEAKGLEDNIKYSSVIELSKERGDQGFVSEVDAILEVSRDKYGENTAGAYKLEDGIYLVESKTDGRSANLSKVFDQAIESKMRKYQINALKMKKAGYNVKGIIFVVGGDVVEAHNIREFYITREEKDSDPGILKLDVFTACVPGAVLARDTNGLTIKEKEFSRGLIEDLLRSDKITPEDAPKFKAILDELMGKNKKSIFAVQSMITKALSDIGKAKGRRITSRGTQTKEDWTEVFSTLAVITAAEEREVTHIAEAMRSINHDSNIFNFAEEVVAMSLSIPHESLLQKRVGNVHSPADEKTIFGIRNKLLEIANQVGKSSKAGNLDVKTARAKMGELKEAVEEFKAVSEPMLSIDAVKPVYEGIVNMLDSIVMFAERRLVPEQIDSKKLKDIISKAIYEERYRSIMTKNGPVTRPDVEVVFDSSAIPENINVSINALYLTVAIFNIIKDSVDYSGSKKVTLKVRQEGHGGINYIIIDIEDSGIGISAERLQKDADGRPLICKLGEISVRSAGAETGHTGLGLPLAWDVMRDTNGASLDIDSRPEPARNHGTAFSLVMPNVAAPVTPPADTDGSAVNRRQFMAQVGAATATAGLGLTTKPAKAAEPLDVNIWEADGIQELRRKYARQFLQLFPEGPARDAVTFVSPGWIKKTYPERGTEENPIGPFYNGRHKIVILIKDLPEDRMTFREFYKLIWNKDPEWLSVAARDCAHERFHWLANTDPVFNELARRWYYADKKMDWYSMGMPFLRYVLGKTSEEIDPVTHSSDQFWKLARRIGNSPQYKNSNILCEEAVAYIAQCFADGAFYYVDAWGHEFIGSLNTEQYNRLVSLFRHLGFPCTFAAKLYAKPAQDSVRVRKQPTDEDFRGPLDVETEKLVLRKLNVTYEEPGISEMFTRIVESYRWLEGPLSMFKERMITIVERKDGTLFRADWVREFDSCAWFNYGDWQIPSRHTVMLAVPGGDFQYRYIYNTKDAARLERVAVYSVMGGFGWQTESSFRRPGEPLFGYIEKQPLILRDRQSPDGTLVNSREYNPEMSDLKTAEEKLLNTPLGQLMKKAGIFPGLGPNKIDPATTYGYLTIQRMILGGIMNHLLKNETMPPPIKQDNILSIRSEIKRVEALLVSLQAEMETSGTDAAGIEFIRKLNSLLANRALSSSLAPSTAPLATAMGGSFVPMIGQPEGGLCVTADTLLTLKSGRQVPIVEIKSGDYVMSLNESTRKVEPHHVVGLLDMGTKPVYKLTTASGRSIKTTVNHPYLTRAGWTKVNGIRPGEEIAVPSKLMGVVMQAQGDEFLFGSDKLYFDRLQLIGELRDVMGIPGLAFFFKGFEFWNFIFHRLTRKSFSSKINSFLSNFEGDGSSASSFPRAAISFSADGGCILNLIMPQYLCGGYTSILEKWTSLVINILFSSIESFITWPFFMPERTRFTSCPSEVRYSDTMKPIFSSIRNFILRAGKSRIFFALNEFRGEVESRLDMLLGKSRIIFNNLVEIFSGLKKLKDDINHYPGSLETGLTMAYVGISGNIVFQSHVFSPLFEEVYHAPIVMSRALAMTNTAWAEEMPDGDIFWDRIVSIERIGLEHVYDIEVEGTHNFIGNNIFAHNTAIPHVAAPLADMGGSAGNKAQGGMASIVDVKQADADKRTDWILAHLAGIARDFVDNPAEAQSRINEELGILSAEREEAIAQILEGRLAQSGLSAEEKVVAKILLGGQYKEKKQQLIALPKDGTHIKEINELIRRMNTIHDELVKIEIGFAVKTGRAVSTVALPVSTPVAAMQAVDTGTLADKLRARLTSLKALFPEESREVEVIEDEAIDLNPLKEGTIIDGKSIRGEISEVVKLDLNSPRVMAMLAQIARQLGKDNLRDKQYVKYVLELIGQIRKEGALRNGAATAANSAAEDIPGGKADWIIAAQPADDTLLLAAHKFGVDSEMAHKYKNSDTTTVGYKYNGEYTEREFADAITAAIDKAIAEMAVGANSGKDPRAIIFAPDGRYDIVSDIVTRKGPAIAGRFTVVKERVPSDGFIHEAVHIDLGKMLLNYERQKDAYTPDQMSRLAAFVRTVMPAVASMGNEEIVLGIVNRAIVLDIIVPIDIDKNWRASQEQYIKLRTAV